MTKPIRAPWLALLASALAAGRPMLADTIPVSYSFSGAPTSIVQSGSSLLLTAVATGTFNETSGVELDTKDTLDLTTGLDNGTFLLTLLNGDQAFGNLFEDDSQVTNVGPFSQKLTFSGGTGSYAGVSGVLDGSGYIYEDHYTVSGSGTLTAPGLVAAPEPSSLLLVLSGCGAVVGGVNRRWNLRRR